MPFWGGLGRAMGGVFGGGGNQQMPQKSQWGGFNPQQQQVAQQGAQQQEQQPAGEAPGGIGPSQQPAGSWDQVMRGNVGTGGYGQQNGMSTGWASPEVMARNREMNPEQRQQQMQQAKDYTSSLPWGHMGGEGGYGGSLREMMMKMMGGGGMRNINPPPGSTPPWMQQNRPIFGQGGGWNNGPNDAMRDGPGNMRGQRQSQPIFGPDSIAGRQQQQGGMPTSIPWGKMGGGGGLGPRNFNPGMMRRQMGGMGQGMGRQMGGGQPTDMVPNGWGGQMTREQAEAMRRSGAVS